MMLEALLALAVAYEAEALDPIEVRGRDIAPDIEQSTSSLGADELALIRPTHPAEVFARLPGAWVTRGSGQEHLSAVRSPILSGAGGCGALLILEQGVPIRPPGFCNVNNLFEVNLAQAAEVAVLRGPGGLGHASGGLHGVMDIRQHSPLGPARNRLSLEGGRHDYVRGRASATQPAGDGALGVDLSLTEAGSFRRGEGYDHQFLTLHHAVPTTNGQWQTLATGARLDQDTAGFILGEGAYADPELRRENLNPEAFRTATAARVVSRGEWVDAGGTENRLTGFARRSRMTFLQHFLPGKPLERNGQVSAGIQFDQTRADSGWQWGMDAELFRGELSQRQDGEAEAPAPVAAIRPPGAHYDYTVDGQRIGGYLARNVEPLAGWHVRAGVHADWIGYDYDNRLSDGNLAEDGRPCDFGGCLYNRPTDRRDDFFELAPELTLSREFDSGMAWLRLARGFRAPQATELYRLQRGQDVADLDSETLDAAEIGVRGRTPFDWEVIAYYQRKDNFIFRDSEGFNVSDGRTGHRGIEFSLEHDLTRALTLAARGSYAVHWYRFDRDLGGEIITSGRDMPSAPRRMGSLDLTWQPEDAWWVQLALEYTGAYWLNADNTRRYSGHTLVHGFLGHDFNRRWSASLRVRNLLDRRYAERADFAFGNYRYFPGAGRTALISVTASFR